MFHDKYKLSNEELDLVFFFRTKRKALKVLDSLKGLKSISFEDKWLLHDLDTGELVR